MPSRLIRQSQHSTHNVCIHWHRPWPYTRSSGAIPFRTFYGGTISPLNIARLKGYAVSLASILIIDKITMISIFVLTCLDQALRRFSARALSPGSKLPFGGKHILLFGDLAQVSAVVSAHDHFQEAFEQFFATLPYAFLTIMSISVIMRQDADGTQLLNQYSCLQTPAKPPPSRKTPQPKLVSRFLGEFPTQT